MVILHCSPPFCISIRALREEGDYYNAAKNTSKNHFYPRPPRGGRRFTPPRLQVVTGISIHALREEGDQAIPSRSPPIKISIHALREEGDRPAFRISESSGTFLSTPSVRRATSQEEFNEMMDK